MLKCEGGCQRMCDEYYRMRDGRIFCYDCWRRGMERAERSEESHRAAMREKKQLEEQIRSLRDKIRYEKESSGERKSYFDSVYDYADSSYVPYNYSKVKGMERDLELLEINKAQIRPGSQFVLPCSYFSTAKWISKNDSRYYETVTRPTEIMAEQEKAKAEAERQRKLKAKEDAEKKKKAEDLRQQEDTIMKDVRRGVEVSFDERIMHASESFKDACGDHAIVNGNCVHDESSAKPDNFLVWAILSTIFCIMPLGIISIVFASKVNRLWNSGNYNEARKTASKARIWCLLSFCLGLVLYLYYIFSLMGYIMSK